MMKALIGEDSKAASVARCENSRNGERFGKFGRNLQHQMWNSLEARHKWHNTITQRMRLFKK